METTNPKSSGFNQMLDLFLDELERKDNTWSEAQSWQLPDTIAVLDWLNTYNKIVQQAQARWDQFNALLTQIDDVIADWYGFNIAQRTAIRESLPWARRRRNIEYQDLQEETNLSSSLQKSKLNDTYTGNTKRIPVTSSQIYSIGYSPSTNILEIEFLSGEIWQYQEVPINVYQQLENSPSKGKYFLTEIKNKYIGTKL